MNLARNGIVVLFNVIEKYKLNTQFPYIYSNFINYANKYVFEDWVFVLHLFIIIVIDTVLGVIYSIKQKNFSSWGFGKVFNKVTIYFLVLIATHNAGGYFVKSNIRFIVEILDSTIYSAIILREYLSILEKVSVLGIWTPPEWIVEKMKIWYETGKMDKKE
jgi:toxin secretion/phage lysis holin